MEDGGSQRLARPGRIGGGALFLLVWALGGGTPTANMAAVGLLMAVWWMTGALPLAATALLPLVLFPLMGILPGKEVAPLYFNPVIFLYVGGFLIALAMERWNLHRRIALGIVAAVGGGPERLVLGFMAATAFLSMWISNTATAVMMLAIALAVIRETERRAGPEKSRTFAVALLLGVAYAASIGGMATLVGTPPNLSLVRIHEIAFPEAERIGFGRWMLLGVPVSGLLLGAAWWILACRLFRPDPGLALPAEVIREERRNLGPMGREEASVLGVFAATALLWIFRERLDLGFLRLPGWSGLLPESVREGVDDGTVAVGMALLLFLLPSRERGRSLLGADVFGKIPWHMVLVFGGGFALAKGFQVSGLSAWIGGGFARLDTVPEGILVLAVCLGLTFLTELTSNVATTEMILPILASVAVSAGISPLLLMIPATLSASCAFMLPVATPPNAIVFASGHLQVADMVRAGWRLNLVGVVVISVLYLTVGRAIFGP
jgi:sodium-dependent dicarboxylate transporter 2/3/5